MNGHEFIIGLVHYNLAEPIGPVAKDNFRYTQSSMEDFLTLSSFLKSRVMPCEMEVLLEMIMSITLVKITKNTWLLHIFRIGVTIPEQEKWHLSGSLVLSQI